MWVYFHLRNGEDRILDSEGRDLPDSAAAWDAALKEARSIIGADALTGLIDLGHRIEVEDKAGRLICSIPFGDAVTIAGA